MSYLKTLAAPKTWDIERKNRKYTVNPNSGKHSLDSSLPLRVLLRDIIGIAETRKEVRKILNDSEVLVDRVRETDDKTPVGIFDTVSFPEVDKYYRVILKEGRLDLVEISEEESKKKFCKVEDKTNVKDGKLQVNLSDGQNIIYDDEVRVGDGVLLSLPSKEINERIPFEEGSYVYAVDGKFKGKHGEIKELTFSEAIFENDDEEVKTLQKYLIPIGDEEAEISIE